MSGPLRGGKYTPAAKGGSWIRPDKRLAIHIRDGMACVYCGSDGPLQLDHYVRVQDGGSNEAANLVTACASCNSSKQNLTVRAWYRKLRARGVDTAPIVARVHKLTRRSLRPYRAKAKAILDSAK